MQYHYLFFALLQKINNDGSNKFNSNSVSTIIDNPSFALLFYVLVVAFAISLLDLLLYSSKTPPL